MGTGSPETRRVQLGHCRPDTRPTHTAWKRLPAHEAPQARSALWWRRLVDTLTILAVYGAVVPQCGRALAASNPACAVGAACPLLGPMLAVIRAVIL